MIHNLLYCCINTLTVNYIFELCTVIQCQNENDTLKASMLARFKLSVVAPLVIPMLSGNVLMVVVYSSSQSVPDFLSVSDIPLTFKINFINLEQCVNMAGRKLSHGTVHPLVSITVQNQVQTIHGTGSITKFLLQFPVFR